MLALRLHGLEHLLTHRLDFFSSLLAPAAFFPIHEILVVTHLNQLEYDAEHHGEVHDELLKRHMQHLDAGVEADAVQDK